MTSDHINPGARNLAPPPAAVAPPPQPTGSRRFSAGAVIGAGLVRLVLGAIATFAVTGFVWAVRVELPPAISATAVADSAAGLRFTAIACAGTCAGRHTRTAAAAGTPRTSAARRATAAATA